MSDKNAKFILAMHTGGLTETFGLMPMAPDQVLSVLSLSEPLIARRGMLEDQPAYRQIIPYVLVRVGDKMISYVRGAGAGEKRLHGKLALGVGGHIDASDCVFKNDVLSLNSTLQGACRREVKEEVGLDTAAPFTWRGLIIMSDSDVNKVHIGVVAVIDAPQFADSLPALSDEFESLALVSADQLRQLESEGRLEGWTSALVPHLDDLLGSAQLLSVA